MELAIAGSIAGTAKIVEPRQHRQQAVKVFETAQITLGEIGLLGCHRSPPANMTIKSCAESNAQISCRTGVGTFLINVERRKRGSGDYHERIPLLDGAKRGSRAA